MSEALPSGLLVSALLRRINDAGGMAMVRARGDAGSGTILLIIEDRAGAPRLLERAGPMGGELVATGPADAREQDAYWRRRRARDPDLWVVELDIADAERIAAETILGR